jgi:hypothetical protein
VWVRPLWMERWPYICILQTFFEKKLIINIIIY